MQTTTLFSVLAFNFGLWTLSSFSQSPNWQWAKSAVGYSSDYGQSISTDANGNVYVTGHFQSPTLSFGSITLTKYSSGTNGFFSDLFVVKYDANGNVLWAKSAGGSEDDQGISISTDANGNVFVSGYFGSPTITFGSITLNNAGGSFNPSDMFIAKYDPNGNVLWAKSAGGNSYDRGNSVSVDASGNVFVTGNFQSSTITFGSMTLTNTSVSGYPSIFVVKYDANGNMLWAKSPAGNNGYGDGGGGSSVDAIGNIFVTGSFQSSSLTFGSTTLTNSGGGYDLFVVKYDANGNALWAKSAGGNSHDIGKSVSVDASGNVFITGSFQSSSLTFGSTTLTNSSYEDVFVVKYDANGNALWAKRAGGSKIDEGNSVSADASGNVFVTGSFQSSSITFGGTTLTNNSSSSSSYVDLFVVKYDANGNALWAKSADGINNNHNDRGNGISADANGNVFVTGFFQSYSITFGSTTITNSSGVSGITDLFIAKLNSVTGIEEANSESNLVVYPNPTSGEFQIMGDELRIMNMEVYNMFGEKVYTEHAAVSLNYPSIDISSQPNGVYFVNVKTENGTTTQKLIINK